MSERKLKDQSVSMETRLKGFVCILMCELARASDHSKIMLEAVLQGEGKSLEDMNAIQQNHIKPLTCAHNEDELAYHLPAVMKEIISGFDGSGEGYQIDSSLCATIHMERAGGGLDKIAKLLVELKKEAEGETKH